MLDRLEAADRAAELLALLRVGQRVVERALRQPERRRRQDHALVVEAGHQLRPAVALCSEQRRVGNAHVVQVQLVGLLAPERLDRRDREALGIVGDEDHREALVLLGALAAAADDQRVRSPVRVRAPHLRAVQDPLAVVAPRARRERADIRSGLGLRHRDGQHAAARDRAEQLALLLLRAEAVQRADDDQRHAVRADRDLAACDLLEEQRGVRERPARAAVLLVDRQAPPAEVGELPSDLVGVVVALDRLPQLHRDLTRREVAQRADEVLLLVGEGEVCVARQGRIKHVARGPRPKPRSRRGARPRASGRATRRRASDSARAAR